MTYEPLFNIDLKFDKEIKIDFSSNSKTDTLRFTTDKFWWGGGTELQEEYSKIELCDLTLNLEEELSDSGNDYKYGSCHYLHSDFTPDKFIIIMNLEKKNFDWLKDSYFKEGNKYISELKITAYAKIKKHPILNAHHEITEYEFKHIKSQMDYIS